MTGFFVYGNGTPFFVEGTMLRKTLANDPFGFTVDDDVVESQANTFEFPERRVDPNGIIILKRRMICDAYFNDRVNMAPPPQCHGRGRPYPA